MSANTLTCGCQDAYPDVKQLIAGDLIAVARHPYHHHETLGCCWDGVLMRQALDEITNRFEYLLTEPRHLICAITPDNISCACGCSGNDERCELYLWHYRGVTQVPVTHVCCRIPGRDVLA